jgi:periplasmic protein TonB
MIRRRHGALAASLSLHGLALLALVWLSQSIALPRPPTEPSIALVFAPAPAHVDAPPTPAEPSTAEPPPMEQTVPQPARPEPKAEEATPAIPQPEPNIQETTPTVPQPEPKMETTAPAIPQHAPQQHPPSLRTAAARPSVEVTRPAAAPLTTPAAVSMAPLTPAHPVAGMESDRPPSYPEIARRRGQQGRVVLHVNVSAEGMPIAVTVAESSGYATLDTAALAAVQQWRFVPASRGGMPIPALAEVPVRFRLTE